MHRSLSHSNLTNMFARVSQNITRRVLSKPLTSVHRGFAVRIANTDDDLRKAIAESEVSESFPPMVHVYSYIHMYAENSANASCNQHSFHVVLVCPCLCLRACCALTHSISLCLSHTEKACCLGLAWYVSVHSCVGVLRIVWPPAPSPYVLSCFSA